MGKIFTHEILHQLTGYNHPIGYEKRLGFTRAYSVFDHPIHYGTFCAGMAAMFWYAENTLKNRIKKAGTARQRNLPRASRLRRFCVWACKARMLVWDRMTSGCRNRAVITFTIIAGLYIGASLVSTRGPIAVIATSMTLDPWTGFYRLQIWENGIDNVWQYPLTGIGLADWERPAWMVSSTVDAFWLVIMLRTGVPSLLLLIIGFTLLIRRVNKHGLKNKDPKVRNLARGWMMSFIALSHDLDARSTLERALHVLLLLCGLCGLDCRSAQGAGQGQQAGYRAPRTRAARLDPYAMAAAAGPCGQPSRRRRCRPVPTRTDYQTLDLDQAADLTSARPVVPSAISSARPSSDSRR